MVPIDKAPKCPADGHSQPHSHFRGRRYNHRPTCNPLAVSKSEVLSVKKYHLKIKKEVVVDDGGAPSHMQNVPYIEILRLTRSRTTEETERHDGRLFLYFHPIPPSPLSQCCPVILREARDSKNVYEFVEPERMELE